MLSSDDVNRAIDDLMLSGRAATGPVAKRMFLDQWVDQIAALVLALLEAEVNPSGNRPAAPVPP